MGQKTKNENFRVTLSSPPTRWTHVHVGTTQNQACLQGRVPGQWDLGPPNVTQHSTTALGTQSQFTPWKKRGGCRLNNPVLGATPLWF